LSSAPSSRPAHPPTAVDLDYTIDEFEPGPHRDSTFYCYRVDQAVVEEAQTSRAGRALDVGCGTGKLTARLGDQGWEAWGLEASGEMLGVGRWLAFDRRMVMVLGIAEALPFPDRSFDRVVCKGSLDHFAEPAAFVREAARVLKPEGRLIIALTNYEGVSCRLGRVAGWVRHALGGRVSRHRPYWERPLDHTVIGSMRFVRALGGRELRMERCYGISLLWAFGVWGRIVDRLPFPLAWAGLTVLDRIAYRLPAAADMIVSVWRPRAISSG
jgi:SAM-dependent methyltransferase